MKYTPEELMLLKKDNKNLFDDMLRLFPTEESIEQYYKEKGHLPKELIRILEKIMHITYRDLIDVIYSKPEKEPLTNLYLLDVMHSLDQYAKFHTTDPKVHVGAVVGKIVDGAITFTGLGCNKNDCYNEKEKGQTYREFLFNSRDKKYRPWDKIIHAEENAIVNAIESGAGEGSYDTAIVTRYPCEKCAQLLVYKGIKTVYYGRRFKISEETEAIFKNAGVKVVHVSDYVGDENDDNT